MSEEAGSQHDRDLGLLRAFEPVVRLTQGEFFLPVGVDEYVRHCSLWLQAPDGTAERLAEPGTLDLDDLARRGLERDGPGFSLSGITTDRTRREKVRAWLHWERPKFKAGSRLAEVGLLGRSIDTISRGSLLVRGAVLGGSAMASLQLQNAELEPDRPVYHARVLRDRGWIICQYWFFYSFNNWRSGFSGVNEHEADWEQVTVYLDGTGEVDADGLPHPRWVVFSAHDEVGDDLRRRWDDPDLALVDGRHPVVFAGAGSHSGAYLPGDYLITIVPPNAGGLIPAVRRIAKVLTPWARAAQGSGFGIPYIDYARGDGVCIGPGQEREWSPVVIGDDTPWVRDYRGLWGHDTRDRLGGERGPAGPRYERTATVRASWGDPLGWAGLAKVAPNPAVEMDLVAQRIVDIDEELRGIDVQTEELGAMVSAQAAGLGPAAPEVRALVEDESALTTARLRAVRLRDERERMERAQREGLPVVDAHAHLRHRRTPLASSERRRTRLLGAWSVVSTPLLLILIALLVFPGDFSRPRFAVLTLLVVLAVEAFARGYFLAFIWRALLVILLVNLAVAFYDNWQYATAVLLALVAVIVLVVNIRDMRRG